MGKTEFSLGEALRILRRDRGMSQAEFAEALGLRASRLSVIERDGFEVRTSTYEAIIGALGFASGRELDAAAARVLAKEARSRRKRCPGCGRDLPVTGFNRSRAGRDGFQGWCRECTRAATRSWRERNPHADRRHDDARRAAYRRDAVSINKERRARHVANREQINARRRELYARRQGARTALERELRRVRATRSSRRAAKEETGGSRP